MLNRSLVEITLRAFTAGGTGAALALLVNSGFESSDVFAFAGSLIGAAATVAGAAWLATHTSQKEHRAECSLIATELDYVIQAAEVALSAQPTVGAPAGYEWATPLHAANQLVRRLALVLDEAFSRAKTLNFLQAAALREYKVAELSFFSMYEDTFSEYEFDHRDERTWPHTLEYLLSCAQASRKLIRP